MRCFCHLLTTTNLPSSIKLGGLSPSSFKVGGALAPSAPPFLHLWSQIITKHMEAFTGLEPVTDNRNLPALRRLYDKVETHVRGLRSLGVFTTVNSCMFTCLTMLTRACLPMFAHHYSCLNMFTLI